MKMQCLCPASPAPVPPALFARAGCSSPAPGGASEVGQAEVQMLSCLFEPPAPKAQSRSVLQGHLAVPVAGAEDPSPTLPCIQQLLAVPPQGFIPPMLFPGLREGRGTGAVRDAVRQESFQCANAAALALMGTATSRLSGGGSMPSVEFH